MEERTRVRKRLQCKPVDLGNRGLPKFENCNFLHLWTSRSPPIMELFVLSGVTLYRSEAFVKDALPKLWKFVSPTTLEIASVQMLVRAAKG